MLKIGELSALIIRKRTEELYWIFEDNMI